MKIKYILLFFCFFALVLGCKSTDKLEQTYSLNVQADGVLDGVRAYIMRNDNGRSATAVDTAIAMGGRFLFKGAVITPEMRSLAIDGVRGQVFFVLESAEINVVAYKDSIQKSTVDGGDNNDIFNAYKSGYAVLIDELNALRKEYASAIEKPDEIKRIQDRNNSLREELNNFGFNFLLEFPNSDFSLMLLEGITAQQTFDVSKTKEILALMNNDLLSKNYNKIIAQKIQQRIDIASAANSIVIGEKAPDFTAPNPDGKAITMSAIKGKVTIIDFWASWCKPCRIENPTYVRLYEQYHDKGLEIISVSLDRQNQKQRWIDAIAKDKLTWYNVSNLKFWNDPVAKLYNVSSIPATFIIDDKGIILAERLRGRGLEAKIAELLD